MISGSDNDGIEAFGKKLRTLRKTRKLSMEKLANLAEIELSQIARIETGKINPKLSTILTIANALDISPKEFFD